MQFILDLIRKIVVLVLLMELLIQMQPGKAYEPYIKMLVGIMVVYSIISGIGSVFTNVASFQMPPMQEFVWSDAEIMNDNMHENSAENSDTKNKVPGIGEIQVEQIVIGEIKVKEIESVGGTP